MISESNKSPPIYHHQHYPRTVNYIAVSVPDLDKAIRWYTEILGFNLVMRPIEGMLMIHILERCFKIFLVNNLKN